MNPGAGLAGTSLPGDRVVVVSNRGPLSFAFDTGGKLVSTSGGGGLASALRSLLAGTGATWVSAAMSDADRRAQEESLIEADGLKLVYADIDPASYAMAYDVIANSTLWFVHHHLFDPARLPRIDRSWHRAWEGFQRYTSAMAEAVAEAAPRGAVVLAHDYHLSLLPGFLSHLRPDLRTVHFTHTPFADPAALRILPESAARALLESMSRAAACGFHVRRWENAYLSCCRELGVRPAATFSSTLVPDARVLEERASTAGCRAATASLAARLAGRKLILRVDRIEPSKNLLRGFWAFDELLHEHPEWRGRVVLVALAYPSRQNLANYVAYQSEVEQVAALINAKWAIADWTPVVLDLSDDPEGSLAALRLYDVLLVNPVRDGLNLVAKEGPVINRNDGALVLSTEAGSYDDLAAAVTSVNPFDISATASALVEALELPPDERRRRAADLKLLAVNRRPLAWLADQLTAATGPVG